MELPTLKGLGVSPDSTPNSTFPSPTGIDLAGNLGNKQESTPMTVPSQPQTDPIHLAIDILHGITRSGAAVGLELAGTPELPEPPAGSLEKKVKDILFGPEALQSLSTRIAEGEQTASKLGIPTTGPFGTNPALLTSGLVVGGTVALDFSGVGGEVKLGEKLLQETSPEVISKLLSKIGVSEDLIPKYSKVFAKATKPEEVSAGLKSLVGETKPLVIPKELQSLAEEASKYKTAEEFAKAQEPKVNWTIEKQKPFEFCQDCTVEGSGEDINKLVENSQNISYNNFVKVVSKDKLAELFPQYKWKAIDKSPLKMSDDYSVSFSRGVFKGEPAYYVTQSGIEYVFTNGTKLKVPKLDESQLTDFYNRVTKGISELTSKEAGMASKGLAEASTKGLGQEAPSLPSHTVPQLGAESSLSPNIAPTIKKSIGEEIKGAIDRFTEAIQTARPARKELEKLYAAERAKRTGAVAGIFEQAEGQKGYFQALGKLKGELTPAEKKAFQPNNLVEQDVNSLFKAAQINPALNIYEKLNTQTALTKVLKGVIPTNSELSLLEKTYGSKVIDAILKQRTLGQKIFAGLEQIVNLPRAVMSSFDLSAPFRQGLMLISHPKEFGSSFLTMFRQFGSEEAFKAVQESITKMPEFALMKQGKLALTDMGTLLTNREEKFMASWAEKIPILKIPIKASNRAYTGFLNKLRADVFSDIVKGARAGGRQVDRELAEKIATFVNAASGRGSLGAFERGATVLNGVFFSPRLMASRIHFLNPVNYVKADPIVRKEMLKSVFSVLGSGLTTLGLAKMAGAKVGDDPRSSDFGKITIGNTRIDIWGGFQQYVRMASQLVTGKYVSSTTGKEVTLGEGYKPLTRLDILGRGIESKEAPVFSFITNLLRQQDYTGKSISVPNEVASRFVPMAIGDMYDIAKDNPDLLPASLLGIFGVGLQTYKPTYFGSSGKDFSGLREGKGALSSLKGVGL